MEPQSSCVCGYLNSARAIEQAAPLKTPCPESITEWCICASETQADLGSDIFTWNTKDTTQGDVRTRAAIDAELIDTGAVASPEDAEPPWEHLIGCRQVSEHLA